MVGDYCQERRKGMATASPKHSIFRSKTVQKYIQNREKSVLPRIATPPVFVCLWITLVLLIVAGIVVWFGQVPEYITGSGVVLDSSASAQLSEEATAIILFPASEASLLRVGLPAQVQIGQTGPLVDQSVDVVNQHLLSPSEVHQQYGLQVADPSLVVTVQLGPTVSQSLYAGSLVQAQIQIGSQSLLSLFPIFNNLLKNT
jgi:hypothetical protein